MPDRLAVLIVAERGCGDQVPLAAHPEPFHEAPGCLIERVAARHHTVRVLPQEQVIEQQSRGAGGVAIAPVIRVEHIADLPASGGSGRNR